VKKGGNRISLLSIYKTHTAGLSTMRKTESLMGIIKML